MMFKNLEVENLGAFSGRNAFDLKTCDMGNSHQPIIIFGGRNGTGKTTLLEAIKICLYGDAFRGRKMPRWMYQKYLRQRLHRSVDGKVPSRASVSVGFDYARSGYVDEYLVSRSWRFTESNITEKLEIEQNNEPLQDVNEEQWQDFLMELIPPGLSRLFFFDGEKIQSLARGESESRHIVNSMNCLLGIDLIEHLQSDLRIYVLRKTGAKGHDTAISLESLIEKKKLLNEKYEATLQKKASLQTKISRVNTEIEEEERQISMEGGGFANKREQLKLEAKKLAETIEVLKEEIRSLCGNLLPFAYVPELCFALRNRLEQEDREQQRLAAANFLGTAIEDLTKDLDETSFMSSLPLSKEQKSEIAHKTIQELKTRIEKMNGGSKDIIHPFSSVERNDILRWIESSLTTVPSRLEELSARLAKLEDEKARIDGFVFQAPQDDVLRPLFERLGKLHQELGMLQQQVKTLEEDESSAKYEITLVSRELSKALEDKDHLEKLSERLKLASRAQEAIQDYLKQLRQAKVNEFSQNFLECFNFLFGKKNLVKKVNVNPEDFDITLLGSKDVVIPKTMLSAGERQVYAIALLWAIAKTSGRQLPFIIDTPLGRLDAEHRMNMMKNFLPHASRQMIVFSTNTEIDRAFFSQLRPYVSRAYQLEYDVEQGHTCAHAGYFWSEEMEIVPDELQ
jgi:DNA sulfur modification protein DndD